MHGRRASKTSSARLSKASATLVGSRICVMADAGFPSTECQSLLPWRAECQGKIPCGGKSLPN